MTTWIPLWQEYHLSYYYKHVVEVGGRCHERCHLGPASVATKKPAFIFDDRKITVAYATVTTVGLDVCCTNTRWTELSIEVTRAPDAQLSRHGDLVLGHYHK